jgi:hypothetical protein
MIAIFSHRPVNVATLQNFADLRFGSRGPQAPKEIRAEE